MEMFCGHYRSNWKDDTLLSIVLVAEDFFTSNRFIHVEIFSRRVADLLPGRLLDRSRKKLTSRTPIT